MFAVLRDIDQDTFESLVKYFGRKFESGSMVETKYHIKLNKSPKKVDVDMDIVSSLLKDKVPKRVIARKMKISMPTLYDRLNGAL